MSQDIRIKKGLDIKLKGKAEETISAAPRSGIFAIKPTDFHGIVPKMVVKVGAEVNVGDVLFYSKANEQIKFTSPVSGKVSEIKRGAKRKILAIEIEAKSQDEFKDFGKEDPKKLSKEQILSKLLESGCWAFVKQRPYDVIANPADEPKAIFISSFDTAPLAPNYAFSLKGKETAFQAGVDALSKLTSGKVNLSVDNSSSTLFNKIENVVLHTVSGKHPAGNVGVQISKINPINQGDRVWTLNPQDVAIIGDLFLKGQYNPSRVIALAGSEIEKPQYYTVTPGQNLQPLLKGQLKSDNVRVINGNVLTGEATAKDGFLGFYNNVVSVIPEGNEYRMFGWLPFVGNNIHSASRTSFSFLSPNKEYVLNANLNGEERAFVETGKMEKVMPIDVFPMQLLKATMSKDIEKMENYGIYEVVPEDFALVDYISSSKIEAQQIIREGLDLMIKEVG